MIDLDRGQYSRSIAKLPGVAGALVSNEKDLVFTSNRGETTVGIFPQDSESALEKVQVGGHPNGLAFDSSTGLLLAANVLGLDSSAAITASIVDVKERLMVADVKVPGRTRWAIFDPTSKRFYVNISSPSQVVSIDARDPDGLVGSIPIPAEGPHGLELDTNHRRLFCACDKGGLFTIDLDSNRATKVSDLVGQPDVIFHNPDLEHLYVAIGNPGVIQVFETKNMKTVQTVQTQNGTHTIAFDQATGKVYAFMPASHQASVYADT